MNRFAKDLLLIIAGALISIIVAVPGIALMLLGFDNPWYVIAAIVYFSLQIITEQVWMPATIYNTINR